MRSAQTRGGTGPSGDAFLPRFAGIARAHAGRAESACEAIGELASTQEQARAVLAALSELEFRGLIRRDFGGRYERAL